MTNDHDHPAADASSVPPDDLDRELTVARPNDDQSLLHLGMVGDTYTVLLSGDDTAGKYTLIDMYVPAGGGPPPHRHNFEEMFSILEGEVELTFRDKTLTARAGETVNVPANAPHGFRNVSNSPSRLLCMCTPPGQENLFAAVAEQVRTRTEPPHELDEDEMAAFIAKSKRLAPQYQTELLLP